MKKLLVPTDFSPFAEKALHYAVKIAKRSGGEIILLHVCDLLNNAFADRKEVIDQYNEVKSIELLAALRRLKASIKEEVSITTSLCDGEVVDSIFAMAGKHNADLIVMGTLGATGLKTILFGTKAAAVINKSRIPVITVPFDYEWSEPKNILIALNEPVNEPALFAPVQSLCRAFGASIKAAVFSQNNAEAALIMDHALSINHAGRKLEKYIAGSNIQTVHLTGSDFHSSIQDFVEKEKIDLLVMVTRQRTFLQNLLRFSATREMAYHTTIPLLSLQQKPHQ